MTTPTPRPDVQALLDAMKANPMPVFTADNIGQMRTLASRGGGDLGELAVVQDLVIPGPGGDLPLRLFDPRSHREPGPAVVFFHGGGHTIGSIDTHAVLCAEIARGLDLPVISVDYRLAPENPWPAAPDDAEAAARWVAENGQAFGRSVTALVICGDSAGGNIALVTGLALRNRPAAVPVALQIALYPGVDMFGVYPSTEMFGEGYMLDATLIRWFRAQYNPDGEHWRASPLRADVSGSPPTLLATAELDPQRDQGRAYAAKLIQAGVRTTFLEARGTIHGFATYASVIPSCAADVRQVLAAARTMLDA